MALRLAAPSAGPSGGIAPSRDARLQGIRRLDWRFLLPEPRLDRVAYLGPGTDRLLPALRECGASVVVANDADARDDGPRDGSFDVAVLQSPGPHALARAAALLRRGGWLYCELARPAVWELARRWRRGTPRHAAGVRGPAHARSLLAELGFDAVEPHWHHPDFERCGWLVPLDRPTAGAFVLARILGRPFGPAAATMGGRILRAGAVVRLLPCVSLIARRGGAE